MFEIKVRFSGKPTIKDVRIVIPGMLTRSLPNKFSISLRPSWRNVPSKSHHQHAVGKSMYLQILDSVAIKSINSSEKYLG